MFVVVDIDRLYGNLLLLATCDMTFNDAAICTDRTLQLGLLRQYADGSSAHAGAVRRREKQHAAPVYNRTLY